MYRIVLYCWVCQRNNTHILSAGGDEVSNPPMARRAPSPGNTTEGRIPGDVCRLQHSIKEFGKSENPLLVRFAQQLHYSTNPLQPGPIFFKTPRKMQFLTVHAEGISHQMKYLIDEASSATYIQHKRRETLQAEDPLDEGRDDDCGGGPNEERV